MLYIYIYSESAFLNIRTFALDKAHENTKSEFSPNPIFFKFHMTCHLNSVSLNLIFFNFLFKHQNKSFSWQISRFSKTSAAFIQTLITINFKF